MLYEKIHSSPVSGQREAAAPLFSPSYTSLSSTTPTKVKVSLVIALSFVFYLSHNVGNIMISKRKKIVAIMYKHVILKNCCVFSTSWQSINAQ